MDIKDSTITFFSQEDYVAFCEQFNNDKCGFAELYDSEIYYEDDAFDQKNSSFSFMPPKWKSPLPVYRKLSEIGFDFKYIEASRNGYQEEGYFKEKRWFITRMIDEYGFLDNYPENGESRILDKLPELTRTQAALNKTVKKIFCKKSADGREVVDYDKSGEYGIISEFSESCIRINVAEINQNNKSFPSEKVIAEYKNIDELISDGWRIDMSISENIKLLANGKKQKVIYIHGLGGSGNGSSANNVKSLIGNKYDFSANTYDLLKPAEAFEQIRKDVESSDIVIASSLGAFYAVSVVSCQVMLLLNPCLEPENTIKNILYADQKKNFNEGECVRQWLEIKKNWDELDNEERGERFGVFSDKDELFSFIELFKQKFETNYSAPNYAMIPGTHEIAKNNKTLKTALNLFWKYIDDTRESMGAGTSGSFWWVNDEEL